MKYLLIIIIIFIHSFAYSNNENIVTLAKKILKLNEASNDYFTKNEIYEKFSDIKNYIQYNLKNGNEKARVDIYLMLDGLTQNNLQSLQSFLATNNKDNFTKEFAESINYNYAEKLAYALKENKRLLITEYIIDTSIHKGICTNYVNSHKISNNNSFLAPAGLPYYISSYCDDNTFSIKKIQSENAQLKYIVTLDSYQKNKYSNSIIDNNLKNIPQNKETKDEEKTIYKSTINNKIGTKESLNNENKFLINTGLGYNYFFNKIRYDNISTPNTKNGSIVYLSSAFQYQFFFVGIDIAPVNRIVTLTQTSTTTNGQSVKKTFLIKTTQTQKGFFLRTNLGINQNIFSFNNTTFLLLSASVNMTKINTKGNDSYSTTSIGFNLFPNLSMNLKYNVNLSFGIGMLTSFSNSQPEFGMGSTLMLGYNF